MIPSAANSDFPKFVADQVLTSDNLNDLFGYLDEQGRMTRTNLIGMGIVCGLKVKTAVDGSSITITKGVGVTSSGYLVTVPDITYTKRTSDIFDAVKCEYYNKFVDIGTKTQKFNLWELKQEAESAGTTALTETFLTEGEKIVLIFVELLEENNKNCDPDSCDDKGTNVTVTFRPLLADKDIVNAFLSNASNNNVNGKAVLLPQTKMPRYDVYATLLLDTENVFAAYQRVLTADFISSVQVTLSGAWTKLSSLLGDDFPADPFTSFSNIFSFLNDGTIAETQVLNLQYFYDFFSDILLAYDELRIKAYETVCECIPDESLFPRHLLLGEAIGFSEANSQFRTRFIPSPVLCCCADDTQAVKLLFKRIVLMIDNFSISGIDGGALNQQQEIKITPSILGKEPISEKAIPFYYNVNIGTDPLYLYWNARHTMHGTAAQILSYKSNDYNTTDDFVKNPLKYDLEPNNFLRIEGHIGKNFQNDVLPKIQQLKETNRLPFDVVFLKTGLDENIDLADSDCCNGDLEISYDIVRREWEAVIGQMIEYLDDNKQEANVLIGVEKLSDYIKLLVNSKNFMVDDLPEFIPKYSEFMPVYQQIETDGQQIRKSLSDNFNPATAGNFAEDLIDHFDEVILSCKKGPFRALSQAYESRSKALLSKLYFSSYAKKNPGIQHKAGVTMGGTFIIVYHENPKAPVLTGEGFSQFSNSSQANSSAKMGTISGSITGAFLDEMNALRDAGADDATLSARVNEFSKQFGTIITVPSLKDIVDNIEDGTVIADFYLPYICCSDCPPINIVFTEPPRPEDLKAEIGEPECDVTGENFTVLLSITGGTKPYKADGQDIAGNTIPFVIESGQNRQIEIEDNNNQRIIVDIPLHTCPLPLQVGLGEPDCINEGENFVVGYTINGGTLPYTVNGNPIAGNTGSLTILSGSGQTLSISDSLGTEISIDVPTHICEKPCNLPCNGASEKCSYILWFQKPNGDKRIIHRTSKSVVLLTDENGNETEIDVTDIFKSALDNTNILNANYDAIFESLFEQINTRMPSNFIGNNEPIFSYNNDTQTFTIEKFVCQDILFDLQVELVNLKLKLHVTYDGKQAVIENIAADSTATVPKFGCVKLNKCDGTSEVVCKDNLSIEQIKGQQQGFANQSFIFSAIPAFDFYYWYFASGRPLQSDEKESIISLPGQESTMVRLLVINQDGCFALKEELVALDFIQG